MRKNPENKPLRMVFDASCTNKEELGVTLALLAVAESNLVKAGKDSALPHFIAIVKALEDIHGFRFVQINEESSL
jgi:hypothetical protein